MQRGHRASTTPMDFEWSNQNGPVDPASPFMNISQQAAAASQAAAAAAAKKRKTPIQPGSQSSGAGEEWRLHDSRPSNGQTGPHSVLDSPSKSGFATPNRLRDPDNRPFYFSQDSSSKPLPLPPHVHNDTWAPRTPASNYDFSSGGETPNTPAIDSDAATPDTSLADKMGRPGNSDAISIPRKAGRRESWFKRILAGSPSPTKAPREKEETRPLYSHKAEHRIQKKRTERSERSRSKKRTELLRDLGGGDDDDSDNEQAKQVNRRKAGPLPQEHGKTYAMSIAGFLHWVEAHPHLPSVLSFYMQLLVNVFLASGFIYILYCAWGAIISDVDIESTKHMSEVLIDISLCAKQYNVNRCDDVVPHMEKVCGAWKTCMSRDPKKVARASVTAKTFAMIFNSFVEEFSYKSMIFTAIIIFGGFNLSNWAFGLLRSQQQQQQHQSIPNPSDFMPQTPHRVPSNNYIEQNQQNYQQQYTPYQTPYGGMRPIEAPLLQHTQSMPALPMVPQEGVAMIEDRKTPRKRGYLR